MELFDQTDPSDEEAWLLVGWDGMLRAEGHLFCNFDNMLEVVAWENIVTCALKYPGLNYRITWREDQLPQRTMNNYELEIVLLEPDIAAMGDERLANHKKMRSIFKGIKHG